MQTIKQLNETEYHSQAKSEVPLFSYSTAKTILQKSPLHAYMEHPKLGASKNYKYSKAMDTGNAIHKILLGEGNEIEVIDYPNYRTDAARGMKESAYLSEKIPLLKAEYEDIMSSVVKIQEQIKIYSPDFFEEHESELSVVGWEMNGVKCQSRFDWSQVSKGKLKDIKTTTDASPESFQRQIINMGYDVQAIMYMWAIEQICPEIAGRSNYEWIVIENKPPYHVAVYEPDSTMLALGEMKAIRASERWREGLDTGIWLGYGRSVLCAPQWALKNEMEISETD